MPDEEPPVPLFRAYLRRKPSGLILVTVLSTLLPRPLFRSYPLDIGDAAAVERSVGHALELLKFGFKLPVHVQNCHDESENCPNKKTACDNKNSCVKSACYHVTHSLLPAVNVVASEPLHRALPCRPEDEHGHADKREEQHAAESHGEFKQLGGWEIFQHSSPHGLHQPCNNAAVRNEEHAGADGYAVNGGHGSVLERVKVVEERAEPQPNIDAYNPLVIDCRPQNTNSEHCASKSTSPVPYPQSTQHLRLRVVWQGFLT